jgi:hypothetical protein
VRSKELEDPSHCPFWICFSALSFALASSAASSTGSVPLGGSMASLGGHHSAGITRRIKEGSRVGVSGSTEGSSPNTSATLGLSVGPRASISTAQQRSSSACSKLRLRWTRCARALGRYSAPGGGNRCAPRGLSGSSSPGYNHGKGAPAKQVVVAGFWQTSVLRRLR